MRSVLDYIAYALVYGLTWLVAHLPRPIFYGLSDFNAFILCYVVRYRREVVRVNLENSFPAKSPSELKRITWAFYRHLSDLSLEEAFIIHASAKRISAHCEFTNPEVVPPYYAQGRSILIAAAHYCNWEYLTSAGPLVDHQMLVVYKPIKNKRIERLMNAGRERMGGITVPMQSTLRTLARYADKGIPTIVGLVADQTPSNVNQYWGEFLHQDTLVFSGVETMAKKFDSPVFFCDIRRRKRGYYSVTLELISDTPREMPQDWITERYLRMLEERIVEKPEYWLWSHRRWKRERPEHLKGK